MNRNRAIALLILPLMIGILSGCPWSVKKNPSKPETPSKYPLQDSPSNILTSLKIAYEDREPDEYKKLFSQDYRFYFNPADVHGDNPTPESWDYNDEMASTENMLRDDTVEGIELDYTEGIVERADSVAFGANAWKMRVTEANLRVHTRNENNEPLTYLVPGTTELFYFRQDSTETVGDPARPKWYIFRWEDQPIAKQAGTTEVASR